MMVKEVAAFDVKSCSPDTDLATAAKIMWDCDCGIVPVVTGERKLVGIITDRDICIAAATRAARPSDLQVRDVMLRDIASCGIGDDLHTALKIMKERKVRRLPVLDGRGQLVGIVSLNDVVARAACRSGADVSGDAVLETMKAICAHSREAVPA